MLELSSAEFASRDFFARRLDQCCRAVRPEPDQSVESRAGWQAARAAAAFAAGVPESRITLDRAPTGAPRATVGRSLDSDVKVSITHRDGKVAAAADRRRRVGIDLERFGGIDPAHCRYFLTEREAALAAPDATTLWVLKEAAWKALQCGGSTPFHAVELQVDDEGELRGVEFAGRRYAAGASLLSPWPEYVLAVVWLEESAQ